MVSLCIVLWLGGWYSFNRERSFRHSPHMHSGISWRTKLHGASEKLTFHNGKLLTRELFTTSWLTTYRKWHNSRNLGFLKLEQILGNHIYTYISESFQTFLWAFSLHLETGWNLRISTQQKDIFNCTSVETSNTQYNI